MGKIYQVIVLGLNGGKTIIDVSKTEEEFNATTVLDFKKKLMLKLPGHPGNPDDIRLIFANNQLEDTDKLCDQQIKDKSTIMMVLRLPGGLEFERLR